MTDVIIVLLLGGGFLLGFFQGVIRGLLAIAAWFVAFVLAAHLRGPIGDWLSDQWLQYTPAYNAMIAFGVVALVLFVTAAIVIQFGTRNVATLSRYPLLDDVIGGLLGVLLALLLLAALIVVLASFYSAGPTSSGAIENTEWTAGLHRTLQESAIGRLIGDTIVSGLGALLEVLLPADVRNVMR